MKRPIRLPRYYNKGDRKSISNKVRKVVYAKLQSNGNVCASDQFWQIIKFTLTTLSQYAKEEQTTHLIYKLFMSSVTSPKDGKTGPPGALPEFHPCNSSIYTLAGFSKPAIFLQTITARSCYRGLGGVSADAEYGHVLLATGTGEVRAELMHEYEAAPFGTRMRSHFHLSPQAPEEIVKALYEHNKQEMHYFITFLPDLYRSDTGE